MAVTTVNNESELSAWITARNAQGAYTEDEFAEIPAGVTISVNADLNLNPVNAGAYVAAIRPATAAAISGRLYPVYGGSRAVVSLRDYVTFTVSGKGRMRGLQLTRGTSLAGAFRVAGGGQYERNIIEAGSSPNSLISEASGGGEFVECVLVGSPSVGRIYDNSDTVALKRCLLIANGTAIGLRSNYGGLQVVGCVLRGFTTDFEGTAAGGSGYNATTAGSFSGTGFGANGQTGVTDADFVNVTSGSEDFSRAPGSTKLGNTGTAISGLTTDFFGTALPQGSANDIGPYEYPEAGDTTPPDITSTGTGSTNGPFAANAAENSTAAFITLTSNESVTWGALGGADASLFVKLNETATTAQLGFSPALNFEALPHANPFVVTVTATDAASNARTVTVNASITNVTELPGAPTIGTATAGNASASVTFTAPAAGSAPTVTGYTVTSSPGGLTGTGSASPITVSGLTNGTAYTFTVTATNSDGTGPASAASNSVTPSAGGGGGDTTPPTMSAASVTGGTLSATGSITSNETGTLWWKMDGSATATDPGAGSEAGAGWTSQSMTASANAVNFGAQPAGTRYGHFIGIDAAGNRAAVVNASGTVADAAVAGFDMHAAAGCVFGAVAGSLASISREVGVAYKVAVYNTSTRALIFESASLTTNSNGRLDRFTTNLATVGVTYDLVAKRVSDGAIACFRLAAT